ncbi:MAG: cbb3-type cytochrome c oxidase subunit I [Actinomycetota bacterium]|nr:cbb3-type cytochrome c oxidase subunit I [Actinomycetota bacterium]
MALTETRHDSTAGHAEGSPGGLSDSPLVTLDAYFGAGDHKVVGRLWLLGSVLFLLAGAVISLVAAAEHTDLGAFTISDDAAGFAQLWSLGRDLLIFGGLIPMFVALAIYVVPLQVGSFSLAFPRGAAAAFWTWLVGIILVIVSYAAGGGPGGWSTDHVVMWAAALGFVVLALLWAMVCIASTVLGARTAGMDLDRVPVASWGFLVFSLGGLFSLPLVVAQLVLAYLDVKHGFLPDETSRIPLVGVTDSVSLAPGLYWLGVPALAIAVEAIGVHTGRPVRFHRPVLALLGLLGVVAYGADMFTFASRGRQIAFDNGLLVAALIASVLPVLATLGLAGDSLRTGALRLRTPLVAGLLSGLLLLSGAAAALLGVIWPIVGFLNKNFDTDLSLDVSLDLAATTFHEGIFGLIVGAAVLGGIAGIHHWAHKIWGRSLDDRLGLTTSLAAAGGGLVWGVGGIIAGFLGQVRLPNVGETIPDGAEAMNGVSTAGVALLTLAALLLLANIGKAATGSGSANEPWQGLSLEWATPSPPPLSNFAALPVVRSATPLADPEFLIPASAVATDAATTASPTEHA